VKERIIYWGLVILPGGGGAGEGRGKLFFTVSHPSSLAALLHCAQQQMEAHKATLTRRLIFCQSSKADQ